MNCVELIDIDDLTRKSARALRAILRVMPHFAPAEVEHALAYVEAQRRTMSRRNFTPTYRPATDAGQGG